jgi:hypothetical protein
MVGGSICGIFENIDFFMVGVRVTWTVTVPDDGIVTEEPELRDLVDEHVPPDILAPPPTWKSKSPCKECSQDVHMDADSPASLGQMSNRLHSFSFAVACAMQDESKCLQTSKGLHSKMKIAYH